MTAGSQRLCFVIMPFSDCGGIGESEWTDFYENDLKPAVESSGLQYECRRSAGLRGNIVADIIADLRDAHVVIADLTGQNPNVFYELAVRHSLQPRTILITRDRASVPFDLRHYGCHEYRLDRTVASHVEFKQSIQRLLREVEDHPHRTDNPIADHLGATARSADYVGRQIAIRQGRALQWELGHMVSQLCSTAVACITETFIVPVLVASPALEHLLATGSIDHHELHINAYGGLNAIHYITSLPHISAGITSPALARVYAEACLVAALNLRLISDQLAEIIATMERGFSPQSVELPAVNPAILQKMISILQAREDYPECVRDWIVFQDFDWPAIAAGSADTEPPAPQSPPPS